MKFPTLPPAPHATRRDNLRAAIFAALALAILATAATVALTHVTL